MRKTVDICHISTMSAWGGVERSLLDFLTSPSTNLQFRHVLATSSLLPEFQSSLAEAGATYYVPSRRFRYDPTAIARLAAWIRRQKIPLVHTYNGRANAWGSIVSLLAGTRAYVAGERGSVWSISHPLLAMNQLAYKRATAIVANSHASKKMILHRYGVDESKIHVMANFVPPLPQVDVLRIRRELGLVDSDIVVGTVGRTVLEKHFVTFVDAAKIVLDVRKDIKFILVGGGSHFNYLKKRVEQAGISHRFLLTGYRKDAREVLQTFDLFVNTSIRESFGNALVEAALAEIPVIAPNIDGIPEVVVDGVTGILLTPTLPVSELLTSVGDKLPAHTIINGQLKKPLALDPSDLAAVILELVDDVQLRHQYGRGARERAQQLFTLQRYQRDLEAIYKECLCAGTGSSI